MGDFVETERDKEGRARTTEKGRNEEEKGEKERDRERKKRRIDHKGGPGPKTNRSAWQRIPSCMMSQNEKIAYTITFDERQASGA